MGVNKWLIVGAVMAVLTALAVWITILINGVTGIINISNGSREFWDVLWVVVLTTSILSGLVRVVK